MIDEILESLGLELNYDDLTVDERETLHSMVNAVEQGQLTMDKIREHISFMKDSVAQTLADEPEYTFNFLFFKVENRKQIILKARLRNYILLAGLLSTPEKARQSLERALTGIARKKTIA